MYSQIHIQDKNCYKIKICYVVNHCKMELPIIITSLALLASISAKVTADAIVQNDSLVPVGEGSISRNLPENFTAISWQEIENSLVPVGEGSISRNLPENFTAISWQEIEDSLVLVDEGSISRNLPENFTAISWQEIADSYLCSSGRAQDIVEALKTFEPDSTWFVLVG